MFVEVLHMFCLKQRNFRSSQKVLENIIFHLHCFTWKSFFEMSLSFLTGEYYVIHVKKKPQKNHQKTKDLLLVLSPRDYFIFLSYIEVFITKYLRNGLKDFDERYKKRSQHLKLSRCIFSCMMSLLFVSVVQFPFI